MAFGATPQHPAALGGAPAKNWPPFYPLVVHDIALQLPVAAQPVATHSYNLFLVAAAAALANVVVALLGLFLGGGAATWLSKLIGAAFGVLLLPALSFGRHFVLYRAAMSDSSMLYIMYFGAQGVEILIFALLFIGWIGSSGILSVLGMISASCYTMAVLCALLTAVFVVVALGGVGLGKLVVVHFRSGGHSIDRAAAEARRTTVSSAVAGANV